MDCETIADPYMWRAGNVILPKVFIVIVPQQRLKNATYHVITAS